MSISVPEQKPLSVGATGLQATIKEHHSNHAAMQQNQASPLAQSVGHFIHTHRNVTHGPLTFIPYEFTRAAAASVPYGFGMAFWHHAFTATKAATQGMEEVAGLKGLLGRNTHRFASSPMSAVFQIATGFTMYRFTGGTVKAMRNKLFDQDPNKTEAQTVYDVQHLWDHIKDHTKVNWKPEAGSTPWGALVLGFGAANVPVFAEVYKDADKVKHWVGEGGKLSKLWMQPKAKLIQNAAVFSVAYATFFEMSERLFKDIQVKRGLHNGYPNSTEQNHNERVGAPVGLAEHEAASAFGNAVAERLEGKEQPTNTVETPHHISNTAHGMGDDPSIRRLVMRQLLPTAVGISAYAAMKRVGYAAVGGPMKAVDKAMLENASAGEHVKHFLGNSWREGAATSMFFTLWAAHDIMKPAYDRMLEKKNGINGVAPDHVSRNYNELLNQLDKKLGKEEAVEHAIA